MLRLLAVRTMTGLATPALRQAAPVLIGVGLAVVVWLVQSLVGEAFLALSGSKASSGGLTATWSHPVWVFAALGAGATLAAFHFLASWKRAVTSWWAVAAVVLVHGILVVFPFASSSSDAVAFINFASVATLIVATSVGLPIAVVSAGAVALMRRSDLARLRVRTGSSSSAK